MRLTKSETPITFQILSFIIWIMKTKKFLNLDCVALKNETLDLLVTQSVGPRIISLRFQGGENLFAELPDMSFDSIKDETYHIYGGHRLWHAPESMPRTYIPDDQAVEVTPIQGGLLVTQPIEKQTGIEKSIQISLVENKPQAILHHTLTNRGLWPGVCSLRVRFEWIFQFRFVFQ